MSLQIHIITLCFEEDRSPVLHCRVCERAQELPSDLTVRAVWVEDRVATRTIIVLKESGGRYSSQEVLPVKSRLRVITASGGDPAPSGATGRMPITRGIRHNVTG